ncbi:DUF1778 domain-containing protein [Luteimonas sp. TWI1416]|uniref:type II toxin-antitoxin system TacA family antitoxin n=1 Tax=unclassified Luteimonas TaxID=2629088 RepID=UPI0032078C17
MNSTAARLDLRIDARDKDRIARAAALRGMPVSAFVRSAVLREADTAIAADTTVALSPAESRHFLAALDAPFQPNDRLQKAMNSAARLTDPR